MLGCLDWDVSHGAAVALVGSEVQKFDDAMLYAGFLWAAPLWRSCSTPASLAARGFSVDQIEIRARPRISEKA